MPGIRKGELWRMKRVGRMGGWAQGAGHAGMRACGHAGVRREARGVRRGSSKVAGVVQRADVTYTAGCVWGECAGRGRSPHRCRSPHRGRSPHYPPFILLGEEVITYDHAHTRGRVHVHTFVYLIYLLEVTLLIFVVEKTLLSPLVFLTYYSYPLSRLTQCLAAGTLSTLYSTLAHTHTSTTTTH